MQTTNSAAATGTFAIDTGNPAPANNPAPVEVKPTDFSGAQFSSSLPVEVENKPEPTPPTDPNTPPVVTLDTPPLADPVPEPLNIFKFDDKEIIPGTAPAPETPTEKAFRERAEAAELKLKELIGTNPEPTELKEPDLWDEAINGDQDKYKTAMREFYVEQGKREAQAETERSSTIARQQREAVLYKEATANYDRRLAAARVDLPDIDAADIMLARELPQIHQAAILSSGVENTEMVAYALYRNEELRNKFKAETNPIRLGVMIADLSKRAAMAPKAPPETINKEPQVKGAQGGKPSSEMPSKFSGATFTTS